MIGAMRLPDAPSTRGESSAISDQLGDTHPIDLTLFCMAATAGIPSTHEERKGAIIGCAHLLTIAANI
jgi:hypothetical protein